ncbi:RNA polymerase sigma factor [Aquimarina sp. MMG015]|uniref:RNA polymerase sigma factor n=1 Tax=Aquimarina TaxID=290174 RepID=UPI000406005D|nr:MULTISPECIES: RNA polymerase sigma factor [Aquimarina]AXT56058.1 RNA polymerase sigma factor [Aquimarina sp. AD1]MBQ4803855.1 RNA polymerase sigma factor [Aquimarina sp. MMG015]RKN27026.1 RNA polymerase sigma factor [Aquimarina sp. AD1]
MSKEKPQLFETIYNDCYPMVLQMCLGYMKGDESLAHDLTQEVFINIWNALDKFKGISSHKTWVYRITVNSCLQHIRKEKNKKQVSIDTVAHMIEDDNQEVNTGENKSLYTAIGKLEEIDRLLIMMVLEGQDYDSISEIMGIKPTNVRVKIHRIKKRLKKILDHE